MMYIAKDLREGNAAYSKVSLRTSQNGRGQNVYRQYMRERAWRNENPPKPFAGLQIGNWHYGKQYGVPLNKYTKNYRMVTQWPS